MNLSRIVMNQAHARLVVDDVTPTSGVISVNGYFVGMQNITNRGYQTKLFGEFPPDPLETVNPRFHCRFIEDKGGSDGEIIHTPLSIELREYHELTVSIQIEIGGHFHNFYTVDPCRFPIERIYYEPILQFCSDYLKSRRA